MEKEVEVEATEVEATNEEREKLKKKIARMESISMFLDKACAWLSVGLIVLNLCTGNWLIALLWFNTLIWNYRTIKEVSRVSERDRYIEFINDVLFETLDKHQASNTPTSNEVIDVKPVEEKKA